MLQSLKKLVISDLDVVKRVAVIVLAELAFLTVWWVFDPWVPVDVETLATANGERFTYKRCDSVDGSSVRWEIANAFGRLALSTWGAFLAFETRRVPAGFNESRYVAGEIVDRAVPHDSLRPYAAQVHPLGHLQCPTGGNSRRGSQHCLARGALAAEPPHHTRPWRCNE